MHYDRKYVNEVEGYSGLIVHGPVIATLLLDLLRRGPAQFVAVTRYSNIAAFEVCGKQGGSKTARLRAPETPKATWRWRQAAAGLKKREKETKNVQRNR